MDSFTDPYDVPFFTFSSTRDHLKVGYEAFRNFWYFIIVLQVDFMSFPHHSSIARF